MQPVLGVRISWIGAHAAPAGAVAEDAHGGGVEAVPENAMKQALAPEPNGDGAEGADEPDGPAGDLGAGAGAIAPHEVGTAGEARVRDEPANVIERNGGRGGDEDGERETAQGRDGQGDERCQGRGDEGCESYQRFSEDVHPAAPMRRIAEEVWILFWFDVTWDEVLSQVSEARPGAPGTRPRR